MTFIVKNNGVSTWTLSDTSPNVSVAPSSQQDLEAFLTRFQMASSNQLLTDIGNSVALSLVFNNGSEDMTIPQALRFVLMVYEFPTSTDGNLSVTTQDPVNISTTFPINVIPPKGLDPSVQDLMLSELIKIRKQLEFITDEEDNKYFLDDKED